MKSRLDRRMSKELLQIELINLRECIDVADFSYDKIDMMRGATPKDINGRCLKLCQDYLGGIWTKQTLDTTQVKRLSGGLTNQLYYCALADINNNNVTETDGVPHEVAIRLYGPKHFTIEESGNERLTDVIIALLVSENKLGPKIYGIFEEGQIQQFLKHRNFRYPEQNNPILADKLFRNLARVHAMDVPINKTKDFLFEYMDSFYEKAYQKFPINQMIDDWNLVTLKKYDLKSELEWLKKTIIKMNSPVLFTHIDFRGANVMVTEPNDEIILCDFEYSCYGYRGFDFGCAMNEWGLKVDELFKPVNQLEKYPDDDKIRSLLRPYFEESVQIFGKKYSENENNSLDQLVREAKLFSMVADIFLLIFCLKTDDNEENGFPADKRVMMEMGEMNFKGYMQLKERFIQDKVFD